jgi:hypothetical protein
MTDEALKLIKREYPDVSSYGRYSEILFNGWWGASPPRYYNPITKPNPNDIKPGESDHPSVIGSWAEDAWNIARVRSYTGQDIWFNLEPEAVAIRTYRAFRHFGVAGAGLKWRDYFGEYLPVLEPQQWEDSTKRFYMNAKEWGKGGHGSGDLMNFRGAIDAYNYYSYEGKREAYLRMGHVLHLLQDIAILDHAICKDHPGSSLTEEEAYDIGLNLAWKKYSGEYPEEYIFITRRAVDWLFGDPKVMGFERLIAEQWNFELFRALMNCPLKRLWTKFLAEIYRLNTEYHGKMCGMVINSKDAS